MPTLVETANWTDAQWQAFIDECFAQWLNKIDARIGYNERRNLGCIEGWRMLFDEGYCEADAIELAKVE